MTRNRLAEIENRCRDAEHGYLVSIVNKEAIPHYINRLYAEDVRELLDELDQMRADKEKWQEQAISFSCYVE